ncbi:type IV pilus secretin family protein [Leeia aquatica]|uniref:Type IV pilus secretin PilQ n=1 Tax=Leeia aquatica TaxID=2725557 RepID=A0A847S7U0_9NEIS|nr:type IV pilus secretin family protein [Leeia aquatica]NLR75077.1 type IV pilus secretin PilQ [Leeia aquatica]
MKTVTLSDCKAVRWVSGLLASVLLSASAWAANSIESVDVSALPGDQALIKVKMSGPAVTPTGFTVATPPRIALDFPNVSSHLSSPNISANQGNLRAVNVVEANGRTRLVVSLLQTAPYEVSTQGNEVWVKLGTVMTGANAGTSNTQFATSKPAASRDSIRDIEFRKGRQGEGRVVIDLNNGNAGIDIRQQGKLLLVDISKATLPINLQRRMDVTDFGTPVQFIDAKGKGESTQLVIEPKGLWEYSAYQTDGQLVIEVKEQVRDPNRVSQTKTYSGEKLSLNFQNVEVRSVIAVLADFTGLNIITSDTVTGNLTLRLKDVPWDQAFDIVLQAKGLDSRRKGNVILVAPREELATKEKLALENEQSIADLEATRTETFQLNYQKAKVVFEFLKDEKNRFLTKRGSVIVDERTNQLFVSDIPTKLDEIRDLLRKIDVSSKQVMIEARVVIAEESFGRQLGGRLTFNQTKSFFGSTSTTAAGSALGGSILGSLGTSVSGSFGLKLTHNPTGALLNLELLALELDRRGKVVSSPRLVTSDQRQATIRQGVEIPYQTCTAAANGGAATCSIAFKAALLELDVTPQITPDNRVTMTLKVSKDAKGESTSNGPAINKREVNTNVTVANGETTVIGGVFEEETHADIEKTPFLGDIPLLGWFFKNKKDTVEKRELLIFVTPRILDDRLAVR